MYRKAIKPVLLLLFLFTGIAQGYNGIESIEDYAPFGTERQYLFSVQDSSFGRLDVEFEGPSELNGKKGYLFKSELYFDYSAIGNPVQSTIKDQYFIGPSGKYIGSIMNARVNLNEQELHVDRQGDSISGYFVNAGVKEDISAAIPGIKWAIGNNMVYQTELFLAFQNFNVGDTVAADIFVPQTVSTARFEMIVEDFRAVQYGDIVDTAYVLHMQVPQEQYIYFSPDHKILRVDLVNQPISIILNENILDKNRPVPQTSGGFSDFMARMPLYLVYFLIVFIFSIPFLKNHYKKVELYFIFILGCAMFPLINSTQIPLQKWFSLSILIPAMREGSSLYSYATIPAMMSGFVQETLKLIPILLGLTIRRPDRRTLLFYGVFTGLGFGFYEACSVTGAAYQMGAMGIFSWGLFERIFTILFHTASATMLAWGVGKGWLKMALVWILLSLFHSLENYTIIFVQKRFIEVQLFELLMAFVNLIFVAVVWMITKATPSRRPQNA